MKQPMKQVDAFAFEEEERPGRAPGERLLAVGDRGAQLLHQTVPVFHGKRALRHAPLLESGLRRHRISHRCAPVAGRSGMLTEVLGFSSVSESSAGSCKW